MSAVVILAILLWNFAISIFNAWSVGRSWAETKAAGGLPRFMAWMAAIMSACGFTWVYTITLALGVHAAGYLPDKYLNGALSLGYLIIIGPVIGSGLAITAQAWAAAWRRRTIADYGIAAYDTFAQVYNMYEAVTAVPEALRSVTKLFDTDADDAESFLVALAVGIVAVGVLGGILTTSMIVRITARSVARNSAVDAILHQNGVTV